MNTPSRGEVMNPPASAAQGAEAGNLNALKRDGTGAVPGREAKGSEAQATQHSAAPIDAGECNCPEGTCKPENNEGSWCWRSGFHIPKGYFSPAVSEERS